MKKRMKRGILLFLISCLCIIGTMFSSSAEEQVRMPELNETTQGQLMIELGWTDKDGKRFSVEGVVLDLYQVAKLSVNDGVPAYTLTAPFVQTGVHVAGLSAADSSIVSNSFAKLALAQKADFSTAANADGAVYFDGLAHGMYLVMMQENETTKQMGLAMDPYLVSVPIAEEREDGYFWNYVVKSHPKTEMIEKDKRGRIEITKKTSLYEGDLFETFIVLSETYYFGLFRDAEGTKPYSENFMKSVHLEKTASGTAVFENLPPGTYYVFETDANGMPIKSGERVNDPIFSYTCVLESETQKVVFEPDWDVTEEKVVFNNRYDELPEGYYYNPKICITKKVMKGQEEITVNETFYAGIFSEKNGVYTLERVEELKQNDTVESSFYVQLTEGAPAQKFMIFETDKDGNRIDKASFGYIVEGEGAVELSASDPEAEITIINRIKKEPEEEGDSYEESTSGSSTTVRSVRTGDESPILLYAAVMTAALLAMIVLIFVMIRRRRR